jgi:hypothetical protein
MKNTMLSVFCLLIISCSSDDDNKVIECEEVVIDFENITTIIVNIRSQNDNHLIFTSEYIIDNQDRVVALNVNSFLDHNSYFNKSTFQYDEEGRLLFERLNGECRYNIVWTDQHADVFNNQNQKVSEFNFYGDKLIDFTRNIAMNDPRYWKFNYDEDDNVISIENEQGIFVEYLDYNLDILTPYNFMKSIGILIIDNKPFFKNIFNTEIIYPFQGDDFSQPLSFRNYDYELDNENRVIQATNVGSIYVTEFIYE